ncbi:MAG: GNAT family N-acetyltransferase [Candidatus Heimdallarchaeota archaeon]
MSSIAFDPAAWYETIIINDEKILIRPAISEDKEYVWKAFQAQDDDFFKFLIQITREMVEIWYKKIDYSRSIPLDAFVVEDGSEQIRHFIGNATLGIGGPRHEHVGGIGMSVIPSYQRRGIGTILIETLIEIGKSLKLRKLVLHVVKENTPAIRLYEKVGFEKEGILRKHHHLDGKDHDMVCMGLLLEQLEEI